MLQGWLDLEEIDVLPWCLNSPDMNDIKYHWDHLDCMECSKNPYYAIMMSFELLYRRSGGD